MTKTTIRQGDVLLKPVSKLPQGCTELPLDKGRIVLAYGEVTGHAHAIADHGQTALPIGPEAAAEIAEAAIARARFWKAPNGERYLGISTCPEKRITESLRDTERLVKGEKRGLVTWQVKRAAP